MKVKDLLSTQDIRELAQTSDLQGARSVLTDWLIIGAALGFVAWRPGPVTLIPAMLVIGGRQLGLAILMHEASHRTLFASRWLNDLVGDWLCAAPIWGDVRRYREHHLRHHGQTGTEHDPDLGLVTPFPTTKKALARKLLRDLSGLAGMRRAAALALMDAGLLTYTASVDARWSRPQERRTLRTRALPSVVRMLAMQAALLGLFTAGGVPWLILVWWGSWLTTYGLVLRIRSMAEHACTARSPDPFSNTRTTDASWLARLLVAPHHVNFHLEHHLLMSVPHWKLPRMHRLLRERGVFTPQNHAAGYAEVLRQVANA